MTLGIGLVWLLQRSARYQNSNAIAEKCQKLWHQRWKHLWHCAGVAAKKGGVPNSSSWGGQWLPSRMRSHFSYRPRNAAVFLLIYFSCSSYVSFFTCRLYTKLSLHSLSWLLFSVQERIPIVLFGGQYRRIIIDKLSSTHQLRSEKCLDTQMPGQQWKQHFVAWVAIW